MTNQASKLAIFDEHPLLEEFYKRDATVHAWFKMWMIDKCSLEEAMAGTIIHLATEKQSYLDEVIKLKTEAVIG